MAGRPKHYEEEELIDRAIEVFWMKGYNAASAKDLLEAMKIGQGSFYSTFKKGKKELYQKSLIQFFKKSDKDFHKKLNQSDDPKQLIRDFFLQIADRPDSQKMNGCYLGNAVVESSNLDEDTRKLSSSLLANLKQSLKTALMKAQDNGTIDSQKCPNALSGQLLNIWNGINVTQRMYPHDGEVKKIIEASLEILD